MLVSDFDFELPTELIAQEPPADRAGARMLAFDRRSGELEDRVFRDLPELLRAGDLLVLNDTRVLPARLYAQRLRKDADSAGRIEVLLTRQTDAWEWKALVRPGKKVHTGERLGFYSSEGALLLEAEVIAEGGFGERTLRFAKADGFFQVLEKIGHMPLPPYIRRPDAGADAERYQTVFAAERGSAAAPTAGLHFTPEVLERIRERGVKIAKVTLHVGLGTFQPVRVERVEDIRLHAEPYTLSQETADEINAAVAQDRRIVAAGTTTVRTLEHCARAADGRPLMAHSGETSLFLSPGAEFKLVGAMLTNFHLPQSTLLMLVCAFGGQQRVLDAYRHAVEQRYRFFSYGDCMFLS